MKSKSALLAFILAILLLPASALALASAELYGTQPYFYGRFEARIQFPPGDGVVGAFFLWKEGSEAANAWWGELDYEKINADCRMQINNIYGKPKVQHQTNPSLGFAICGGYHDYRIEWTPTYISWVVDGKEIRKDTGTDATAYTQNASGGMTFHFNIWPGDASFGGNIKNTTLPVHQFISWVQYSSYDNGSFTVKWREEFQTSSVPSGWAVGNWASPFNLSTHNTQNVSFVNGIAVLSLTEDNATGKPVTPPPDGSNPGTGGSPGTGGKPGTGGSGSGGSAGGSGGTTTTSSGGSGGTTTKTTASGGTIASGGTTSSGSRGGSASGGTIGSGGSSSAGGSGGAGGTTSSAGGQAPAGGTTAGGGRSDSGGAAGSGGQAMSGGTTATGVGGTAEPTSTSGGTSGGSSDPGNTGGGCSCRIADRSHRPGSSLWVVLLLGPAWALRRRARRGLARLLALIGVGLPIFLGGLLLGPGTAEAKAYKGAEVYSNKSAKYGRIEIRMRMIRGSSLISTFFTYKNGSEVAGTSWEEIDVEALGQEDAKTWQSNLITGNPRKTSEQYYTSPTSVADAYHTYRIEWTPSYVSWSFDDTEMRRTEGGQAAQLTNPHSFRFNAWSSEASGWAGDLDESALPAYQYVNWIRYYRYENDQFVLDWTDDFDSFDTSRWSKGTWTFEGNRVDFDPANAVVKEGTLILAITKEGATGFAGTVPADPLGNASNVPLTPSTPTTPTAQPSSGGGCSLLGARPLPPVAAALCLLGLVGLLRARRRRR